MQSRHTLWTHSVWGDIISKNNTQSDSSMWGVVCCDESDLLRGTCFMMMFCCGRALSSELCFAVWENRKHIVTSSKLFLIGSFTIQGSQPKVCNHTARQVRYISILTVRHSVKVIYLHDGCNAAFAWPILYLISVIHHPSDEASVNGQHSVLKLNSQHVALITLVGTWCMELVPQYNSVCGVEQS